MQTLTKKDLIDRVAELTDHTRIHVRDVAQTLLDLMVQELGSGKRLELRDFGVFEIRTRKGRQAKNPRTHASVVVPARTTVRFKPGRLMRERLAKLLPRESEVVLRENTAVGESAAVGSGAVVAPTVVVRKRRGAMALAR